MSVSEGHKRKDETGLKFPSQVCSMSLTNFNFLPTTHPSAACLNAGS